MADNQTFKWTGIDKSGKRASGTIQAAGMKEAQQELRKMEVKVENIIVKSSSFFNLLSKNKKIKPKDIVLFTRYLATMISAGLPILRALDVIASDKENAALHTLVVSVRASVAGGKTLAESFNQFPKAFNGLYVNLVKAGEKSGTLTKILNRLGAYLENSEALKRKIKKAMVYPIAIIAVALIVSLVLLIFVVPQFQTMFSSFGASLPWFTRQVVNLSDFLRHYWWILLFAVVGLVVGIKTARQRSERFNDWYGSFPLKIFLIGPLLRKGIIARFTSTLSTTLDAGMPIVESMRSMADIMGNKLYKEGVLQISDMVSAGHPLSSSMNATKLFPNMVIQMIAVGEESGELGNMLNKVAEYYEAEVNNTVDTLNSLIEPIIMVVLGVVIGSFVIAMYLPIFKLGSLF